MTKTKTKTVFIGGVTRYDIRVTQNERCSFGFRSVHRTISWEYEVRRAVSRRTNAFSSSGEYAGKGVLFKSATEAMEAAVEAAADHHRRRHQPRPTVAEIESWVLALAGHISAICPTGDGIRIANWAMGRHNPDRDWKAVVRWMNNGGHRRTFSRAVYARVFFGAEWPEEQGELPKPQMMMEYYDAWWECSRYKGGGFAPEDIAREILSTY